ncbi:MAG TPA: DUF5666 domain-containing protein [Mycobacterium sp.]
MSALSISPRLAILAATGATTLCISALCTPAMAHAQGDVVIGPVASVSGNTLEVTQPNGSATVDLTDSTRVSQAVPAGRDEIIIGSCITAGPTPDSAPADGGTITAKWVLISTAVDGKCPHRQGSGPTPAEPAHHYAVRGVVDSVAGDTVTVTRTDAAGATSPATVTVTDATHYKRRVPAAAAAITQGSCVAAGGTRDGSGVLQATRVTVWVATDGACPQPTG